MFTRDYATVTAAVLFAFFGSVACGAEGHVVFSQPDVSDIGERVYVIERRPLGRVVHDQLAEESLHRGRQVRPG